MSNDDKAPVQEADAPKTDKAEETVPSVSEKDKPQVEAEALSQDVPEKLKGKSPEEIVKIYGELEKKLGEQSGEVNKARETQEKMNIVLKAIWSDPDLYRQVDSRIQSIVRGEDTFRNEPTEPEKKDKEAGKTEETQDQRRYLENRIISDFQEKLGIDKLRPEERQELMNKVSTTWANMIDPKGKKTKQELLSSVELDVLPTQLENAYWLANKDSLIDKGSQPDQDAASIGSMPSGSGKSEGVEMTPAERETAEKLGVPPDKYAKRKQQIRDEFAR